MTFFAKSLALDVKFKVWQLLAWFFVFYSCVHAIRHIPGIVHGHLDWSGEKTYVLSVIRIAADMVLSYLFTFCAYWSFFRWYPAKRFAALFLTMGFSLALCYLLGFCWTKLMEEVPVRSANYLPGAVLFYSMDSVFGVAYYFVRYTHYRDLRDKDILLQARQSELSFLRSQLNPHFLFNSLNNIYSMVYERSDRALDAIDGLSELLRYMLYHAVNEVPLADEITCIEKYIALQQLRFEHPQDIQVDKEGALEEISVPPLLLIPFVENAFKHGDPASAGWLWISLNAENETCCFCCANRKMAQNKDPQRGIGIDNIRRRLALLYPGRHILEINEDKEWFNVRLELQYGK